MTTLGTAQRRNSTGRQATRPRAGVLPIVLLLVVAALLKLWSDESAITATTSILAGLELALAAWLMSRWQQMWALRAIGIVFVAFAGESLRRAWLGYSTCGCLGAIAISPWAMLVLDLLVVAIVLMLLRDVDGAQWNGRWRTRIVTLTLAGMAAFAPWIGQATQRPRLIAPLVDLGSVAPGSSLAQHVEITNTTGRVIEVWSTSASCTCGRLELAPCAIAPGAVVGAEVRVDATQPSNREGTLRIELRGHDRRGNLVMQLPARVRVEPATDRSLVYESSAFTRTKEMP